MPTLYPGQNNLTATGYLHATIAHAPGEAKQVAVNLLKLAHALDTNKQAPDEGALAQFTAQASALMNPEYDNLHWVINELKQGRT